MVDGYNEMNGQSVRQCKKKLCSSNNQSYKCQNNGTCAPDDESSDKGSKCICQVCLKSWGIKWLDSGLIIDG